MEMYELNCVIFPHFARLTIEPSLLLKRVVFLRVHKIMTGNHSANHRDSINLFVEPFRDIRRRNL